MSNRQKFFASFFQKRSSSFLRTVNIGAYVYGLGIIALGIVCFASRSFVIAQGLPERFPYDIALAYAGAVFLLVDGTALEWRRTMPWAAASLTAMYAIVVLILIDIPFVFANPAEYGSYSDVAEDFAVAAAALIITAATANIDTVLAARLTRLGQILFGVCAVLFGGAHFFYLNLTVPLVPKYLPPSPLFWAYATGIFHIAAGLAILARVRACLAAILLTVMYASFTPLVHLPLFFAAPDNHFYWSENAVNLALTGAAWVVADSFRMRWVAA